jgi:hypothetical protein
MDCVAVSFVLDGPAGLWRRNRDGTEIGTAALGKNHLETVVYVVVVCLWSRMTNPPGRPKDYD